MLKVNSLAKSLTSEVLCPAYNPEKNRKYRRKRTLYEFIKRFFMVD